MNILIIEDELSIQQTLQDILELNAHTVSIASDGIAGVRLAEKNPDIILCDIGLPDMDGYEVLESVRRLPSGKDTPFIFLTARASREDQRKGMTLGADDYITKPFTEEEIINAINARVQRQKPLKERVEQLVAERKSMSGAKWSHELMTPLNGILGGLELIEMEVDSIKPDELRPLLAMIRTSAERQLALAQKLMFYYELEHRKLAANTHKVTRCDAQKAVTLGANRAAREQNRLLDLSLHCDHGDIPVFEGFLTTGIAEVVENAFHYSKIGQPVSVSGHQEGDHYIIKVINHGLGMTDDQCKEVAPFRQFAQTKFEQKGLGIGLSIARSVAELAGGKLHIHPHAGEGGLEVTFELPCLK